MGEAEETICHMLFGCSVARKLLEMAGEACPSNGFSLTSVESNVDFLLDVMCNNEFPRQIRVSIPWTIWAVWKKCNAIILSERKDDLGMLARKMADDSQLWFEAHAALITRMISH